MPEAKNKSSSGVSIDLENDQPFFTPGTQIAGHVTLNTAQDFAIGSVKLEFYGRVKVHYVQSHGQGESHWRGRATLFSEEVLLYEGYHTHKPGSFSWPFSMTLPTHPDAKAVNACKHQWEPKDHFLSTGDFLETHSMPPTFKFRKRGVGFRYNAFVEYVLKVRIEEAAEGKGWLPSFAKSSTLPIRVAHSANEQSHFSTLPCAAQFTIPQQLDAKSGLPRNDEVAIDTTTQVIRHTLRSSKLLQSKQDRQSSIFSGLRDKAISVVSPESLPKFSIDVVVKSSTTTQLFVDKMQFKVGIIQVTDPEHTTITAESYPEVRLDNVSLSVEAATYIRFKSIVRDRSQKTKYDIVLCEKHPVNHVFEPSSPTSLVGTSVQDTTSTEDGNLVDVLKMAGISTALGLAKLGRQTENPLRPTFNTYIIARQYRLNWRLELDVAGEKIKISNEDKLDLKVLAPEASSLAEVLKGADIDKLEVNGGEKENSDDEKGEGQESSKTFQRLSLRRSKQQEAADEAESAEASGSTQINEALPAYQPSSPPRNVPEEPPQYAVTPKQ